jgi:hypothetical protein
MRLRAVVRFAIIVVVAISAASGCASPTGRHPSAGATELPDVSSATPDESPGTPIPSHRPPRSTTPSPTGFGELIAVGCDGRPSAEQVITVLRRRSVIPAGSRPTVTTGPLCAGTWQNTVLTLPGREPVHVGTRGAPDSIVVETAGTNPCTAQVRANAPAGIVSAIRC